MDAETKVAMDKVMKGEDHRLTERERMIVKFEMASLHSLMDSTDSLLKSLEEE